MSYFDAILPKNTGTEILGMANGSAEASAGSTRDSRIAELERELADVRARRKALDTEEGMAKYRFVFEGDPGAYLNLKQSLRNDRSAEEIRKSNERTSRMSALKSAWETTDDKRTQAEWEAAAWKRKFEDARTSRNPTAMREAAEGYSKANALLNHYSKKMESIAKEMGVKAPEFKTDSSGRTPISPEMENEIGSVKGAIESDAKLNSRVEALDKLLDLDKKKGYKTPEIQATAETAAREIPEILAAIESSTMPENDKSALRTRMAEIQKKANNWSGTGTGKPKKILSSDEEKESYRKKVFDANGKLRNETYLKNLGSKTLKAARKYFPEIPESYVHDLVMEGK